MAYEDGGIEPCAETTVNGAQGKEVRKEEFEEQDDFIALPSADIRNDEDDDSSDVYITDIRAAGDGDGDGNVSSDSEDESEGGTGTADEEGTAEDSSRLAFADAIGALGFEISVADAKRGGTLNGDHGERPAHPCPLLRCKVEEYLMPSFSPELGSARLLVKLTDLVRASIHAGRHEVARAAIAMGRKACSANRNEEAKAEAEDGTSPRRPPRFLSKVLNYLEDRVDASLRCPTHALATESFRTQLSLALLTEMLRSYGVELEEDTYAKDTDVDHHHHHWVSYLEDLKTIFQPSNLNSQEGDERAGMVGQGHLEMLRSLVGSFVIAKDQNEAAWIQRFRRTVRNALNYIPPPPEDEDGRRNPATPPPQHFSPSSAVDDPSPWRSRVRRLLWRARLGRTLGGALRSLLAGRVSALGLFSSAATAASAGSMPHCVLEPLWQEARRHFAAPKKSPAAVDVNAASDSSSGGGCAACESFLSCAALTGPAAAAAVSCAVAEIVGVGRADGADGEARRRRLLSGARAQGTITGLYRASLRLVRQMGHASGDRTLAKGSCLRSCRYRRGGGLAWGLNAALLLSPLRALSVSMCVGASSVEAAHHLVQSALSSSKGDSPTGGNNSGDRDGGNAWRVHSELLWSQLLRLEMTYPRGATGEDDDDNGCSVAARRAVEYGVFPRHVLASFGGGGESLILSRCRVSESVEGNGASSLKARNACKSIVDAVFRRSGGGTAVVDANALPNDSVLGGSKPSYSVILDDAAESVDPQKEAARQVGFPMSVLLVGDALSCLRMQGWGLSHLPRSIGSFLVNVKILDVSENNLRELPPSICRMRHLTELDVSSNSLMSLPPEIGNLTQLKALDASDNGIEFLPKSLTKCVRLEVLDLRSNPIGTIPGDLPLKLTRLRALQM
uniref:Disease resistance R13L4/SHOC-2-like LRR domain-containing protein n=1 Tax=Odontella aurita TaxID=265563 RepID=A0A7S4JII4_9STRA